MERSFAHIFKCLIILLLSCSTAFAQVTLPAIFGDNMVLQRGIHVPVYGWATAGEKVQIDFMGKTYNTTTGADGKWIVKLSKYKAGGPYEMHIKGTSTNIDYKNILIGEVWLASGQSNMEFGIQTEKHSADAISKATDNLIHVFYVPMALSLQPLYDVAKQPADSPNGKWLVCSPDVMANPKFAWHGITAVGYYFAQQIRKTTGAPVGLIGSYRGGTPAQAWVTEDGLKQSPAFTKYVDIHQKLVDNYDNANANYPQKIARYQDSVKTWFTEVSNPYNEAIKKWDADVTQAKANNQPEPPRPKLPRRAPIYPPDPLGGYGSPTICYNGVIAPLQGYGIKGVIWYQGESNGDNLADAVEYKDLFPRMITNWRAKWGQGNFPFLFVQLPNFRNPASTPSEGSWAWVREAQQKILTALPKTGMAVITDAGETGDIHPGNKLVPGNRLALVARHDIYGEKVVSSGPVYKSMKIDGDKVIISFNEVNKGLVAAGLVGDDVVNIDGLELKGFGIAGEDHVFVWAKAVIKGNTVVVSRDVIPNPQAVRYNWADNPPGNLYNKDGLPANPFRTDDWPAIIK